MCRVWPWAAALMFLARGAAARPNTHAPAISTWDPRASSVVLSFGRALGGDGAFTFASYNANFSSTNGVLSAQFGVHYTTFKDTDESPTARGVSASGVALISVPLASRFDNGVPRSAFAFYIGGVPTAMFSGQLNFISVPLVLGVGLPFSPSPYVTFRPWVELSPGLNFDTHIQAISTDAAVQSAMDGTLTREEVEALVEEGLGIQRQTTLGKRAGLSIAGHLGERVDIDVNMMLGAGHPGALSLGAGLVLRWDAMVHELERDRSQGDGAEGAESCEALALRYHRVCRLRRAPGPPGNAAPRRRAPLGQSAPGGHQQPRPDAARGRDPQRSPALQPRAPVRAAPPGAPAAAPESPSPKKRAPAPGGVPSSPPPAPAARPAIDELPPLQAAPPRTP